MLICLVSLTLLEVMRRRRRGFFDEIFEGFEELFEGIEASEGSTSSMYSISVTYDDYGRPVVKVSARGNVDRRGLEKYLRERYPGAKIVWEGGPEEGPVGGGGHVREVTIEEVEDSKQKRSGGVEIKEVGRPRIFEVKVEDGEKGKKWYDIKVE